MAYENDRTELERQIGFTSEDVAENRAGKLTERQRGRLNRKLIFTVLTFIWIIVLMVIALMILGLVEGGTPARLFIFAVAGAFMAIRAFDIWRTWQDLSAGSVAMVEGKARVRPSRRRRQGQRFPVYIEDKQFWVTARQQQHLHDGLRYKVYYTPNVRMIVSVEIMG